MPAKPDKDKVYVDLVQAFANLKSIKTMMETINHMQGFNTMAYTQLHAYGIHTGQGTINGRGPVKQFCVIDNTRYMFDTEEEMLTFICEHLMTSNQEGKND